MKRHLKNMMIIVLVILVGTMAWAAGQQEGAKQVTLRMGDNIPDRNNPWGLVIDKINAEFMEQHPNVKIETESYPDQPYQEKMKIYAASDQLPDVFKYWSFSTLLGPLVESNMVLALDMEKFKKKGFVAGSLEANVYNGKLYGIPVSGDLWVIYYNQKILKELGITMPTKVEELIALSPKLREKNLIPMVTEGSAGWTFAITLDSLVGRIDVNFNKIQEALDRKIKFTDPVHVQSATILQNMAKAKLFQEDLITSDYGASRNLFGQQKAAMYLMGSWELGLSSDASFSDDFRNNVRAAKFPALASGKGNIDNLVAWFGGNYVINAKSKNIELGKAYLDLYSDRFPDLIWEKKGTFPAQKVQARPDDNDLAKDLLKILGDAKITTGDPPVLDRSTPEFKEDHQKYCKELVAGLITPLEFCQKVDVSAEKAAK